MEVSYTGFLDRSLDWRPVAGTCFGTSNDQTRASAGSLQRWWTAILTSGPSPAPWIDEKSSRVSRMVEAACWWQAWSRCQPGWSHTSSRAQQGGQRGRKNLLPLLRTFPKRQELLCHNKFLKFKYMSNCDKSSFLKTQPHGLFYVSVRKTKPVALEHVLHRNQEVWVCLFL